MTILSSQLGLPESIIQIGSRRMYEMLPARLLFNKGVRGGPRVELDSAFGTAVRFIDCGRFFRTQRGKTEHETGPVSLCRRQCNFADRVTPDVISRARQGPPSRKGV